MTRLVGVLLMLFSLGAWAQEEVSPPDLLSSKHAKEAIALQEPLLKAALKKQGLEYGAPIFVRIFKDSKTLELWVKAADGRFKLFRNYPICEMSGELGPKTEKGDDQAPEGFYTVNAEWMHPKSGYHLAFNIGYPNLHDRANEWTGKAIMVHGKCASSGCFAMTNPKIDEIYTMAYAAFMNGQDFFRVHVFPFRMTEAKLKLNKASPWAGFWANLREGYDLFEKNGVPPNDFVMNRRYYFTETTDVCEVKYCKAKREGQQWAACEAPIVTAANLGNR
jgi:murein L,D-transpeptidase YafK